MAPLSSSILYLSALFPLAFGHSMVADIWANSVHYYGFNPNYNLTSYPSDTPAWYTTNVGGNPLYPVDAKMPQIICAKGGSNANISVPVTPGTDVRLRWWQENVAWPESHHGPVINYLAACNGPCSKVDMRTLKFVKISERGFVRQTDQPEGYWATDELIADNGSWNVRIPAGLAAGEYVLRHELIALHIAFTGTGAYSASGAEFYPQCVSLKVGGSGTKKITGGVDARTFYSGAEPSLRLNIHETYDHSDFVIPGPKLWAGAIAKKVRSFTA
ncbi:lytic polysaccharide monooxygenase [Lentithecium fluviatile CBS 122367]|uniref:Lytic polysaccharide monooxygenase n=1 Tax=Lentithecium fluviatile CBS 122367 TaxID=1168545 RepID=A0A6G1IEH0_9PLEO|nr:lytic polysaccharide monooxygenase [Lentithecium fluviatile CBS 122367]